MSDITRYTMANRAAWDASAPVHAAGEDWGALVAAVGTPGFSVFDATMTRTLRGIGVDGARVVQVGCNNGREILSLPSLGAVPVLGIDQSQAFLDQARRLAELAGSECRFLCADIYNLPQDTPRGFDLAIITIGVLNWMPDLPQFFEVVADLLAPGGRLVIYETHPVLEMFEPESAEPFKLMHSYFEKEPYVSAQTIVYDGLGRQAAPTSYWFSHTMGAIVTGCATAGLAIEGLAEYGHSNRETEFDIYEGQQAQLPMCFTLVARKQV